MSEKFELTIEAERYIHNDLSNCAYHFQRQVNEKLTNGQTEGVYLDMMACLVFSAFSIEAKINFVGWKTLENGWPERASLREKIDLLAKVLSIEIDWGQRPWQTVSQLKRLRDTLAHGKPEIVNSVEVVDVEPEIWEALRSQWERSVTQEFVNRCRDDERALWEFLLERAAIPRHQTLTAGGHSLKGLVEQ